MSDKLYGVLDGVEVYQDEQGRLYKKAPAAKPIEPIYARELSSGKDVKVLPEAEAQEDILPYYELLPEESLQQRVRSGQLSVLDYIEAANHIGQGLDTMAPENQEKLARVAEWERAHALKSSPKSLVKGLAKAPGALLEGAKAAVNTVMEPAINPIWQGVKVAVGSKTAEEAKQDIAESAGVVAAGAETGTRQLVEMGKDLFRNVRAVVDAPDTGAEALERLRSALADRESLRQAALGKGLLKDVAPNLDLSSEEAQKRVADVGLTVNPLLVAGPLFGKVAKLLPVGSSASGVTGRLLGNVAGKAGRAAARTFEGVAGSAAEGAGKLARTLAEQSKQFTPTIGAAAGALVRGDVTGAAVGGLAGLLAPPAMRAAGWAFDTAGKVVRSAPVVRTVEGAVTGATGAALAGLPLNMLFVSSAPTTEAAEEMAGFGWGLPLAMGGAKGGVRGFAGGALERLTRTLQRLPARYGFDADMQAPTTLPDGTVNRFDAATQQALSRTSLQTISQLDKIDPQGGNLVKWVAAMTRSLKPKTELRTFVVPEEQFKQVSPGGTTASGFFATESYTRPDGTTVRIVVLNAGDGARAALHESMGHFFVESVLTPEERTQLHETIKSKYSEADRQRFMDHYNLSLLSQAGFEAAARTGLPAFQAFDQVRPGWRRHTDVNSPKFLDEMSADLMGEVARGIDGRGLPPGLFEKSLLFLGGAIERLGLYTPEMSTGNQPVGTRYGPGKWGFSPEGIGQSFDIIKLGREFFKKHGAELPEASQGPATPADLGRVNPTSTPKNQKPLSGITVSLVPPPAQQAAKVNKQAENAPPAATIDARSTDPASWQQGEQVLLDAGAEPTLLERFRALRDRAGQALDFLYYSVMDEDPRRPRVASQRKLRRAQGYIEEELGTPLDQVRAAEYRQFIPGRVVIRTSVDPATQRVVPNVNIQGTSPLLVSSNAVLLARALRARKIDPRTVLPIDFRPDNTISDTGFRQLSEAFAKYSQNQAHGRRGDGGEITRPANYEPDLPAFDPNYVPQPLDKPMADAINLLMGQEPPRTTKKGSRKSFLASGLVQERSANENAQLLARANLNEPQDALLVRTDPVKDKRSPRAGLPANYYPESGMLISEMNPLRHELAKKGIDLTDLLEEVSTELNLEHMQSPLNTVATGVASIHTPLIEAGFMPSEIRITGPDGQEYPARLDGWQDMRMIGRGVVPQITVSGVPGFPNRTTTYGPQLEKAGFKLPEMKQEGQFMPKQQDVEFHPNLEGAKVSTPRRSYRDAQPGGSNPWVRKSVNPADDASPSNADRQVMVQFSSDLLYKDAAQDQRAGEYYDKLYSGARPGYARMADFWEIPQWQGFISHVFPKADVYVVRDMAQAKQFLREAKYGRVLFSALDTNATLIKELAKDYPGTFDVGGYTQPKEFADTPNIKWHDSIKSLADDAGVPYREGVDYRHYEGSDVIPRLTMSQGCRHKCAFCSVPKAVTETPAEVVTQQADAIAELGSKLVYLNDKTFGQASNYRSLSDLYKRIKQKNPNFSGFVIQTTAAQMQSFTPEWLAESGIKFVELGIETYNDPILKEMHKPATERLIDRATDKLRKNRIALIPNIIIGLPGETQATYAKTLEWLKANKDIISHANIYNLAVYQDAELGKKLTTASPDDFNENVLEKSFHKDPAVHQQFAGDLYGLAREMLEGKPEGAEFMPKEIPEDVMPLDQAMTLWRSPAELVHPLAGRRDDPTSAVVAPLVDAVKAMTEAIRPSQKLPTVSDQTRPVSDQARPMTDQAAGEFMPSAAKTKSGQDLEAKGFRLEEYPGRPLLRIMPEKGVEPVGFIEWSVDANAPDEARVQYVKVEPEYRGQGVADTLYREMLTRLQGEGVTSLGGSVIHSAPTKIREKLLANTRVVAESNNAWGARVKETVSDIPADAEFMAKARGPFKDEPVLSSKMWILPDGTAVKVDNVHEQFLKSNAKELNKAFGAKFGAKGGDDFDSWLAEREHALDKGFARITYEPNRGQLTIEAKQSAWGRTMKDRIFDLVEANLGKIDNMRVALLNDKYRVVKDESEALFRIPKAERMNNLPLISDRTSGAFMASQSQFDLLDEVPVKLRPSAVKKLPVEEQKRVFPEAVVLEKGKGDYDIVNSPLLKGVPEAEREQVFADALVKAFREVQDDPDTVAGSKWYSEFVPMLRRFFGEDAEIFAQFLAATSPRNNPHVNWNYAYTAYKEWKAGKFKRMEKGFNKGLDLEAEGKLRSWVLKNVKPGDPHWPKTPVLDKNGDPVKQGDKTVVRDKTVDELSKADDLHTWIKVHDLIPKQPEKYMDTGEERDVLYGNHGLRLLQVISHNWLALNDGLKVRQFFRNLIGEDHGATIDVWAARLMRRLGYEGHQERWRLLPHQEKGVADRDFLFSQAVFKRAAEELGMTPDDLQGAMWFAEKKLWANRGWSPLDFGSYTHELKRIIQEERLRALRKPKKAMHGTPLMLEGLINPQPEGDLSGVKVQEARYGSK